MQPYVYVLNNPLQALERDNYQCVFTKRYSIDSPLYAMPTNPSVKKAIIDAATGFPRGMTREAVEQDPILANGIIVYVAHVLGDAFNCDYGSPRTDDEENQRVRAIHARFTKLTD